MCKKVSVRIQNAGRSILGNFVLLLFLFAALDVKSQTPGEVKGYFFTDEILASARKDSSRAQLNLAALQFSFIGDYQNALFYMDKISQPFNKLSPSDSASFKILSEIDARQHISRIAKDHRAIMVNEAHHNAQHRVFTQSLLQPLYEQGYRYLCVETLNVKDTNLNHRKYPVLNSGWYSIEPQYGELIRSALRIGYRLVAYEDTTDADGLRREVHQAENIGEVFKADPDARILVHAGYDHIREDSAVGDWGKAMAGRLREMTGIDPFTIDQEIMMEHFHSTKENPYRRLANASKPAFYAYDDSTLFYGPLNRPKRVDARLFHPKTTYKYGRPEWLTMDGSKKYYVLDHIKSHLPTPCLVFAYNFSEDKNEAVPADVIEVRTTEEKALILYPGKYNLLVKDRQGKIILSKVISVAEH